MLNLGHTDTERLACHKFAYGLFCRLHHILVLGHLVVYQCQSGQRNEHVTGTTLEPRISGKYIILMIAMYNELVCAVYERIVEIVTGCAHLQFKFSQFGQCAGVNLAQTGREDYALTHFHLHLKVTGNVQILVTCISAFLFLRILYASIPIGLEDKLIGLVQLHIEFRITRIHAGLDSILHHCIVASCSAVLMRELSHTTESQERLQTQCRCRMSFYQCVADNDTVLKMLEHHLAFQDDTAHTICCGGNLQRIKLSDILMSTRAEIVALELVKSQIEFCAMLYHSGVQ